MKTPLLLRLPPLFLFALLQLAGASVVPADPAPGDRGVMLTAIRGATIEEIPLTYIGVQRNMIGPGFDVHLVQLDGPVADRVGVAAGMSGSPVYFDGELLGALAYRFGALPTEAVAGVTPIADMLGADRAATISGAGAADPLVSQIGTPIQVSGMTGAVRDWIGPQLEALGFVTVSGGDAGSDDPAAGVLAPGSPVGVALVRGDMSMAATGTVTLVDGNTVYAFGHPFLGAGKVEIPMVAAEVVHTLADRAGSVKMARVGAELGAIVEDRLTAIVGRSGQRASMIPLSLSVSGADYGEQQFDFEIARSEALSPLLAAVSVASALSANLGHGQEATMLAKGTIRIKDMRPLPVEVAATSGLGADPAIGVAITLQQVLGVLWVNPFGPVELEGIDLQVSVDPEVRSYRVEELHYDRGPLRPGQDLPVECVLRPYRGEPVTRSFVIHIPDDLPKDARLALAVGSPSEIDRALGRPLARRYGSAEDVRAVIDILGDLVSENRLTAVLYRQSPGVVSRGVAYADLPPSAERLMAARPGTPSTSRTTLSALFQGETVLDGPVEGGLVVRLRVESGLENGDETEESP